MARYYAFDSETKLYREVDREYYAGNEDSTTMPLFLSQGATSKGTGYTVSTIFLGISMDYSAALPILFETMIFYKDEPYQERYSFYLEAELGHRRALRHLRRLIYNDEGYEILDELLVPYPKKEESNKRLEYFSRRVVRVRRCK